MHDAMVVLKSEDSAALRALMSKDNEYIECSLALHIAV